MSEKPDTLKRLQAAATAAAAKDPDPAEPSEPGRERGRALWREELAQQRRALALELAVQWVQANAVDQNLFELAEDFRAYIESGTVPAP